MDVISVLFLWMNAFVREYYNPTECGFFVVIILRKPYSLRCGSRVENSDFLSSYVNDV